MANQRGRIRRVVTGAAIGGAVGAVFGLLIALGFADDRFARQAMTDFSLIGLIVGVIGGIVLGALHAPNLVIALGGMVGGLMAPFLLLVSVWIYSAIPWPSPRPYPSTAVETDTGGGSWGSSRFRTYTVALSLDDIQQYYEEQMRRYCQGEWQFQARPVFKEYWSCRETECRIRRLWREQYFGVTLCSVSEKETEVYQWDGWED